MVVHVTRLHSERMPDGKLVVLRPGDRVSNRVSEIDGSMFDEVSHLQRALGDRYVALVNAGILVEG